MFLKIYLQGRAMSDRPAPSSAVPGRPTRQSTLRGCMGALPQMFQWRRMLGSNNKCIATPHADVQIPCVAMERQTRKKPVMLQHQNGRLQQSTSAVEGSSMIWKEHDGHSVPRETVGLDLRQVLHAKQEPFVLQDVIREKRQPMRTPSSRELKFEAHPTRRSTKMKDNPPAKDHKHTAGVGHSAADQSQYCWAPKTPTGSAAVVRRNRGPVESMVAMPSHQAPAMGGGHFATKAHSKAASLGRSPVKSPNKRALLMEAAARILEGSNHRTYKRPSMSILRSLSEELDKSKHVKELSKPKEKLVRVVVLHSESSESEEQSSPIVVMPEDQRAAESKQHQLLGNHNREVNSCKKHFEVRQIVGGDLLVMQNRILPYSNTLDEAEVVPSLATPVQSPGSENRRECEHLHGDLCSGMKGIQKEALNQIVRGFKLNAHKTLLRAELGANAIVIPRMIPTEDQLEFACDALLKDSGAIMPSKSVDSRAAFIPVMVMSSSLPNFDYIRSFGHYALAVPFSWGYHSAAPFPVGNPEKIQESSVRTSCIEVADGEAGYKYRLTDKFVEAEKNSAMQLRLCNYSWWAPSQNNSSQKQLSTDYCVGYGSPVAATHPSYLGKVWNEEMSEEGASGYGVFPADEFQQASPVSVLEPLYEEELEHDDSFDNFEVARHKLLEKVRRYEMLAHMDVETLEKVSEEEQAWDDKESYDKYGGGFSSDSSSSQASPAHEFVSHDVEEAQDSYVVMKRYMKEPYVVFVDDQMRRILYEQEVEVRTTNSDVTAEKLELMRPIISSSCGGVTVGKNSLLGKEEPMMTMSDWRSGKEEEEVEQELESCFLDVLMCELLCDLLKAQFTPQLCNAYDLGSGNVS